MPSPQPLQPPQGPASQQQQTCFRHPKRPTGIACVRCERPICPDCMTAASVGFQCPDCVRAGVKEVRRPSKVKNARVKLQRIGPVTATLIGLNVLVFIATAIDSRSLMDNYTGSLANKLALYGPYVSQGDWWRVLTAMFLHLGPVHLVVNMFSLYVVGSDLEKALGKIRYTILYVVAGLGGSLAVILFTPHAVVAGASGAIFGLLGAAFAILFWRRQSLQQLVSMLVLNIFISLLPGISLTAHIGGFITGAIVGFVILLVNPRTRRRR